MARQKQIDAKYPIFKPVDSISSIVGIGENRIRNMIKNREIEFIKCGTKTLLTVESFYDWYERNKTKPIIEGSEE